VSEPFELGSVIKPLTLGAVLNEGAVTTDTSYFDAGFVQIGDRTITNVEEVSGSGTRSMRDILQLSLNTGAVYLVKQLGDGEVSQKARLRWHDYLTSRYGFGKATGVEQEGEAGGLIPNPTEGDGLAVQYANTSFGQGMLVTPVQLSGAVAALVNGGSYYQPTLIDARIASDGKEKLQQPKLVNVGVVSAETSQTIREYMQYTVEKNNPAAYREGYVIGGKTGTAQIAKPEGGYYDDRFNGTYMGFVGKDNPQYIIVVTVIDPKIAGYAGSKAAAPIFAKTSNTLIDAFGLSTR
jgi:cell division protein FtsI/penicillin-binding protein 2